MGSAFSTNFFFMIAMNVFLLTFSGAQVGIHYKHTEKQVRRKL